VVSPLPFLAVFAPSGSPPPAASDVVAGAKAVGHTVDGQVWVHPDSVAADKKHTLKVLALDAGTGKEKVVEDNHERVKDPDAAGGAGKRSARSTTAMHSNPAERP